MVNTLSLPSLLLPTSFFVPSIEYKSPPINSKWDEVINRGQGWECDKGGKEWITSYNWCERTITVDLSSIISNSKSGILSKLMDNSSEKELDNSPMIRFEQQIIGTGPKYDDLYSLTILLLTETEKILEKYESGEIVTSDKWQNIVQVFENYEKGARFLRITGKRFPYLDFDWMSWCLLAKTK